MRAWVGTKGGVKQTLKRYSRGLAEAVRRIGLWCFASVSKYEGRGRRPTDGRRHSAPLGGEAVSLNPESPQLEGVAKKSRHVKVPLPFKIFSLMIPRPP